MNKQEFEELVESVKEGGKILRNESPPSRKFDHGVHVAEVRTRPSKLRQEFAKGSNGPPPRLRNDKEDGGGDETDS